MKKFTVVILFFILNGCASYYKVPSDKASAILEIESDIWPVFVQHFENEKCETGRSGIRLSYIHPDYGDKPKGISKQIEAGREFVITFKKAHLNAFTSGTECAITGKFFPIEGETYKAKFLYNSAGCYLVIFKKEKIGDTTKYVPEETFLKSEKICFNAWVG